MHTWGRGPGVAAGLLCWRWQASSAASVVRIPPFFPPTHPSTARRRCRRGSALMRHWAWRRTRRWSALSLRSARCAGHEAAPGWFAGCTAFGFVWRRLQPSAGSGGVGAWPRRPCSPRTSEPSGGAAGLLLQFHQTPIFPIQPSSMHLHAAKSHATTAVPAGSCAAVERASAFARTHRPLQIAHSRGRAWRTGWGKCAARRETCARLLPSLAVSAVFGHGRRRRP